MSSKVIDPVCRMEVDPANSAGSFEYKGATYHFCSIRCRDKFKNDPDSFVTRATPHPAAAAGGTPPLVAEGAPLYNRPLPPETPHNHPRMCTKLQMTHVPVPPIPSVSYTKFHFPQRQP